MRRSRKIIIVAFVLGITIFGCFQYVLALQIDVKIKQSHLLEVTDKGSTYNIELEFKNPSLWVLTAGETEFFVVADEEMIGKGKLEPFVLPSLGSSSVNGTFLKNSNVDSKDSKVKISGVTKYDVIFTSIDVPFVFYPTQEQAREFIRQN
jgi:hypothetical protein